MKFHTHSSVLTGFQALNNEWMEAETPKIGSLSSEGFQGQPVLRHEKAGGEPCGEPDALGGVASPLHVAHTSRSSPCPLFHYSPWTASGLIKSSRQVLDPSASTACVGHVSHRCPIFLASQPHKVHCIVSTLTNETTKI